MGTPGAALLMLTNRQTEIVRLLADGKRDPVIGEVLGMTPDAVKQHVYRICNITGCNTRAGLVAWAIDEGIIHPRRTV